MPCEVGGSCQVQIVGNVESGRVAAEKMVEIKEGIRPGGGGCQALEVPAPLASAPGVVNVSRQQGGQFGTTFLQSGSGKRTVASLFRCQQFVELCRIVIRGVEFIEAFAFHQRQNGC